MNVLQQCRYSGLGKPTKNGKVYRVVDITPDTKFKEHCAITLSGFVAVVVAAAAVCAGRVNERIASVVAAATVFVGRVREK